MESKVRITLTGTAAKKFLKKFFGKSIKDYNVSKVSTNHWVVEFGDGDDTSNEFRLQACKFRLEQDKRFLSKRKTSKLMEVPLFHYRIQRIINFDENEIEPRFTRINWQ